MSQDPKADAAMERFMELTRAIVARAEEGDWEGVIAISDRRDALLGDLPTLLDLRQGLDPAAQEALLAQALADNERVVALLITARQRVLDELASAHSARQVLQAYESSGVSGR